MENFQLLPPEHKKGERITNFEVLGSTKKIRWPWLAVLVVLFVLVAAAAVFLFRPLDNYQNAELMVLPIEVSKKVAAAAVPEILQTEKRIEINLSKQIMLIFENDKKIAEYVVSTGRQGKRTKAGDFSIISKYPVAWGGVPGQTWKMPYFMGIYKVVGTENGIHELPFINGFRESSRDLGYPVSHGCVRLPIGPAEKVYNWAQIGTPVIIYY